MHIQVKESIFIAQSNYSLKSDIKAADPDKKDQRKN